jgi:hypothetical protein
MSDQDEFIIGANRPVIHLTNVYIDISMYSGWSWSTCIVLHR